MIYQCVIFKMNIVIIDLPSYTKSLIKIKTGAFFKKAKTGGYIKRNLKQKIKKTTTNP